MNASGSAFKVGTRSSRLALAQTDEAVATLRRFLPSQSFEVHAFSSPGDRDKSTDLRQCAPDFFTRDLHDALREGHIDGALHSAKDLEDPLPPDLDWFWLPDPADPRDVIVLRPGETLASLPADATAGISSQRREHYIRRFLPGLRIAAIRGTIDERLAQLDAGHYDLVIMAAAALVRIGAETRITQWIPLADLPTPEGQGHLALTFRAGDPRWLRIRSLFVKCVTFAGAGAGDAALCTLAAAEALDRCDLCLPDALIDTRLLDRLPPGARRIDVGKRAGRQGTDQATLSNLIADFARRGRRVVRLKGGDPGIFGRLTEEIETLDALQLPYRVIPGVSSLTAATTGTGLLLTRRGISSGFTVMTPRRPDGRVGSIKTEARAELPLVLFMSVGIWPELAGQLRDDGRPGTTPVAVVLDAGSPGETVMRGTLADIGEKMPPSDDRTGLILIGSAAIGGYPAWGALGGRRILLPCSDQLQPKAAVAVRDLGGIPVPLPLIRLVPDPACLATLRTIRSFDGVAITSPASVRILMQLLPQAGLDVRALPQLLVAGPGTAAAFQTYGLLPDFVPDRRYGSAGLLETAQARMPRHATLLRLRSQQAGPGLAEALGEAGFRVTDCVLYTNEPTAPDSMPACDAVFFASASAVKAFIAWQPGKVLNGKPVLAMGPPTVSALNQNCIPVAGVASDATVESAIQTLAAGMVEKEIGAFGPSTPLRTGESARPDKSGIVSPALSDGDGARRPTEQK